MIEVRLVTGCVQYEQAWNGLLPQLWEYTKKNNPDCVKNLMETVMEKFKILMKNLMMVSSLNMYYLCPCLCYGQLITSINYFAIFYIHSQGSRLTVVN